MQKPKAPPYYRDLLAMDELEVRPASSLDELKAAFHLVHKRYVAKGLVEPPSEHEEHLQVSIYNAVPQTVTFVGVLRGTVIATATLVADSDAGLPMDKLYRRELQELRNRGRQLTEVTMLADRRRSNAWRTIPMLFLVLKRLFDRVHLQLEADDACITVHPDHADFYKNYLLFEELGPEKPYPSVNHNPAVALRLNFRNVKERYQKRPRLRSTFLENRTDSEDLKPQYSPRRQHLEDILVKTGALRDANRKQLEALNEAYPGCPWYRWWRRLNPSATEDPAAGDRPGAREGAACDTEEVVEPVAFSRNCGK